MSRNTYSKVSTPIRKYCKVCQDAGKTEAEFTSHFTRESPDPKSKVVCPTLLALECKYCYKPGHTVKYCSILKEKEKEAIRAEKKKAENSKKVLPAPGKNQGKNSNLFKILDSESDEEEESTVYKAKYPTSKIVPVQSEFEEEYPALCAPAIVKATINGYASALANPAPIKTTIVVPLPQITIEKNVKEAPWNPSGKKASEIDWAAWDSSSDEEENENQEIDYDSDW